ncbi:serine/threonine protein kinase, FIKK family [Plasmodium sp. gorilla clade G2]|uniref:serine/threonine protein kinase, FIKK family n=1 Tax=Plasmodium sp. gorilla clade G2 TaxID=880535 RepID=UPI000D214D3A|nr:serine/threonine protein kinase, FIKK family [Plasmodium sp. gorilla clade G2]SOV13896.1 serine/threonine protein kinase, FIKK family [Plasmodium sp. gorilla clade G2]
MLILMRMLIFTSLIINKTIGKLDVVNVSLRSLCEMNQEFVEKKKKKKEKKKEKKKKIFSKIRVKGSKTLEGFFSNTLNGIIFKNIKGKCDGESSDNDSEKSISYMEKNDINNEEDNNVNFCRYNNIVDNSIDILENVNKPNKVIYNWKLGKESLLKMLSMSKDFSINGVKYEKWKLSPIDFGDMDDIYKQKKKNMFKSIICSSSGNSINNTKVFIKKINIMDWLNQFDCMDKYDGEYMYTKDNFVMEAVALSFLEECHKGITPKLHKILFEPDDNKFYENVSSDYMFSSLINFNNVLRNGLGKNLNGNIVIVSELYGDDILKFKKKMLKVYPKVFNKKNKKKILFECLKLIDKLHDTGLSHLDITPENILISDNFEFRICDFGKSTPLYTNKMRHIKRCHTMFSFESCCPYVGKMPFIPPECLKLYKIYRERSIHDPLKYLNSIWDTDERRKYYFDVTDADKYMLGILFIWIWNDDYLWNCSDPLTDKNYMKFEKNNMSLDTFRVTKKWPKDIKIMIKYLIDIKYRKNIKLKDLIKHPWWFRK